MRLHRFIGDFDLSKPEVLSIDKDLANQILKVLRIKTGERVILCDGNSNEAEAEIALIRPSDITFKILKKYQNENEPRLIGGQVLVTKLYLSVLKKENFELATQKAVEIGVSEIIPILSERTVKTGLNMERLKKIIREASEQSGRGIIPTVVEPITFENAIKEAKRNNDLNLFFDLGGKPLVDVKHQPEGSKATKSKKVSIFIGPEGGWGEKERSLAEKEGFEICSFGKLVYRAETAVIVGVYHVIKM